MQEDKAFVARAEKEAQPARVVNVKALQFSLDLWEPICLKGDPTSDEPLVLVPEGYSFVAEDSALEEIGMVRSLLTLHRDCIPLMSISYACSNCPPLSCICKW